MGRQERGKPRREDSLSRERIIDASIELLDASGEGGLTFRTLSERLATGPGAIYWHIASKNDLMTAACDAVVARTLAACAAGGTPEATIRLVALGMFDAIEAHPWVGSALFRAELKTPMIRVLEVLGQQVRSIGPPKEAEWAVVSALMNYILGAGGLNAANSQLARKRGLDRHEFLGAVSAVWAQLDPRDYPFTRSVAGPMRVHDDRLDFVAGIDLILGSIAAWLG